MLTIMSFQENGVPITIEEIREAFWHIFKLVLLIININYLRNITVYPRIY